MHKMSVLPLTMLIVAHSFAVAGTKPNVIFMLTDDLGYSDIGCYGAARVKTPHIDRLAAEGIRFTDFHTAASICSPSRAAFLTGAYPQRAGLYMGINPNRRAHWFLGLHPDEITIAEQFDQQGYVTHMVGKWHLGTEPEFLPRTQGFDHYYGMPCNFGHSPKFFDDDNEVFAKTPLNRLTQLYTKRITSIIRNRARSDEQFFLYYAHNWSVGQILDALKANGVDENTLVIFTSDNGPGRWRTKEKPPAHAGPLRGRKGTTFEGGMREPTVIRWPGKIPAGKESDELMTAMDLLPTFAKLAGAHVPTDRIIDGKDIWPTLTGESKTPHDAFFYHRNTSLQAVRSGKWKLHTNKGRPTQLYNLETDIGETNNVIKSHPNVAKMLDKRLKDFAKDIADNTRPAAFVDNPKPLVK